MNTVLLVEDEPFNQTVLEDIFEFDEIPAELVCVESGEEAIEKVVELKPILILMDIGLPGIDGLETTRRIKANPETADIPIWALTAHAMKGDAHKAIDAGCASYLTKPVDGKDISDHLREFLTELAASGVESCINC